VLEMMGVVVVEDEIDCSGRRAQKLAWEQLVLVFIQGARRVLALGLEDLGFPENATHYPPI
jgi:hypothetical protein